MPNHCSNRLTVRGRPKALKEFMSFVCAESQENDKGVLDFNKLCPMPDDRLQQLLEGQQGFTAQLFPSLGGASTLRAAENDVERVKAMQASEDLEEQAAAERFLQDAWYGWRIEEWGTKWNAYDVYISVDSVERGVLVYHFSTAWSPPVGVIRAAAERFSALEFKLEYAEDGCDFAGVFEAVGDVYDDDCVDGVLNTEYGREMFQDYYDEMDEMDKEEEEQDHAEDQNDSPGGE